MNINKDENEVFKVARERLNLSGGGKNEDLKVSS